MKKPGYREMLRDRCPKVVNYALKWCKAKEKWIDHVYFNFIRIYAEKDQRNNATRIALGISEGNRYDFNFEKTIDWDNLTPKEKSYWIKVNGWVKWFMKHYAEIENTYDTYNKLGENYFDIQVRIIKTHLSWLLPFENALASVKQAKYDYVDKFSDYLMQCIEGKN